MTTNLAQHTPAPWYTMDVDGRGALQRVADVDHQSICGISQGRPPEECIANAELIAAAPELLRLLRGMVQIAGDHDPDMSQAAARDRVIIQRQARKIVADFS